MRTPYEYQGCYIDGTWSPSAGAVADVRSPATDEVIGSVSLATAADIDRAVAAARRSLESPVWSSATRGYRANLLRRLSAVITSRRADFGDVLAQDVGSPVGGNANVPGAVARLDYYAGLIDSTPQEELRHGRTRDVIVRAEPVGVVGAILPWNAPLGIGFMKMAPAIAAGCAVVIKTAVEAPLVWGLLTEALDEAEFPPGIVNVLCADRDVSETLVRHRDVDKVSFTGSTAVGRKVGAICGADLKRCSLELGGKSAAIMLDDVDLDRAMGLLLRSATSNNGQACVLQSRVLVPRARAKEIAAALGARMAGLRIGDPRDPATDIGPLITETQRARVETYIRSGLDEGARLVTGGSRVPGFDRGWWLEPTLFEDVTPDMRIAREEIFGPVVSVIAYDDEDDAVAIANSTEYGLSGTVWTTDPARGLRVARAVRSGNFGINVFGMDVAAPFGGMKCSGIGREMGPEGLAEYIESKSIHLPDGWVQPT